ncbi:MULTISPECIES: hypothetical protein [unclassified Mesorhizobium]|uniref:hypothetical protein n=1 Tax=unclassified Mesorhizobium TaxID=325217 RepID=UPI00112A5704|nr:MULTISPECIES: hypothetical protein [unclassified Mesorhizobium]TPM06774.1 hypothetical protein FJ939_11970 [Mesorhizobium sp. B2-3-8]TPM15343.1 hypothetical protein FJ940_14135 [Mesorhizobium sp. B2-3-7]
MDILEIDAVSFAGRVAHVAAAELAGLLVFGEVRPLPTWFAAGTDLAEGYDVTTDIEAMAVYVSRRLCIGETLYRSRSATDWEDVDPAIKMAFDLFASTTASVVSKLLASQEQAEKDLELATRPPAPAIAVEDTIYETEESLHTLRPEAVQAQKQIAHYDQAQKADRKAKREAKALADAAKRATRSSTSATKHVGDKPAPMSVGEAPPAAPVNRGGRGHKKQR